MGAQTAQSRAAAALASVWQGPLPGCIDDPTGRVVLVLDITLGHCISFVQFLWSPTQRPMTHGEDEAGGHTLATIVSHDELNAIAELFSEDLPRATARRAIEAPPSHSIKAVVILDGEPAHVEDMPLHTT